MCYWCNENGYIIENCPKFGKQDASDANNKTLSCQRMKLGIVRGSRQNETIIINELIKKEAKQRAENFFIDQ